MVFNRNNDNSSCNNIIISNNKRRKEETTTIHNTTTKLLCYILFICFLFCFSSVFYFFCSSIVLATENKKNCLREKDGDIVYNVDEKDNECSLLYNIGDLSVGIGVVNRVSDNLAENITGGNSCQLNTDTDSHFDSYRTAIVAQNKQLLNNSSVNISCRNGYELTTVGKNKISCVDGVLNYDEFEGCYYTGNNSSSLTTAINQHTENKNYTRNDLDIADEYFAEGREFSSGEEVIAYCRDKEGYTLDNSRNVVVFKALGNSQWEATGECGYEGSSTDSLTDQLNQYTADKDYTTNDIDTTSLDPSKHYATGDTVTLNCKEKAGYSLSTTNNTLTLTAGANDNWNITGNCQYTVAGCERYSMSIENGFIAYSNDMGAPIMPSSPDDPIPNGATAGIYCNYGYVANVSSTATCSSGSWSGTVVGTCSRACSMYESNITGAYASYNTERINDYFYSEGTVATLTCKTEYGYAGELTNNTLTCSNGEWVANGSISGSCSRLCSEYDPRISGTTVSYSTTASGDSYSKYYSNGTVATVSCGSNYYFDGSDTVTCSNGEWTGTVSGSCKTTDGCFIAKSINTNSITINYFSGGTNGTNNCIVDWGDGTTDTCDQTSNSHSYSTSKQYTIKICGNGFRGIGGSYLNTNPWIAELISFGSWSQITDMEIAFYSDINLTKIHSGAFNGIPNVTSFVNTFRSCSSLTSIPAGLFDKNVNVTSFQSTFDLCSSLTSIPAGLFDKNVNVTSFQSTFDRCFSLTSIPAGLFDKNVNVTDFSYTFIYCRSLTSIPAGLFDKNVDVTNFEGTFYQCSSLTSIPAGLFDKNEKVTKFGDTFAYCTSLKCVDIDGENSTTVKSQRPLGGGTSKWGASGVSMAGAKSNCKVE